MSDAVHETEFNEHNIRRKRVNGADLKQHRGFDPDLSAVARRLLARGDISEVNVGRQTMTVWIRREDVVAFEPPEGFEIASVSAFCDSDRAAAGVALDLKREGSA